ncbi:MAG: 2-amino-4-hydroxy-6-hydroxymethyldihydropteridine diphosphokinase [Granulosicoccaceae bacterium]|jgi:2-amino-4-hydroxy-6-hydroxymethyldihydropteridine diphosphokinase
MPRVYLSLGSNIDAHSNLRAGMQDLHAHYGELQVSTVYESEAVGFDGDNFINFVVGLDTDEDVHTVQATMSAIEQAHGRVRGAEKFSSRTLDIDILLYDDLVINENGLHLPRDEIEKYAFVLQPLAELAPQLKHPVSGKTYAELWQGFDKSKANQWPVALSFN